MPSPNPQIQAAKPAITAEEPLRAEIKHFLDCVRNRTKPLVDLEAGRRALAVALDIVAATTEHGKKIKLEHLQVRG